MSCHEQISKCLSCALPTCVHDLGKHHNLCPIYKEFNVAVVNDSHCGIRPIDDCVFPFLEGDMTTINSLLITYDRTMSDI